MELNDLPENTFIQVRIINKDSDGEIRDALYYTESEWKELLEADLEKDKADRVKAHKDKVKAMSEAPAKKSKDYSEEDLREMAKMEGCTVEELKERLDNG